MTDRRRSETARQTVTQMSGPPRLGQRLPELKVVLPTGHSTYLSGHLGTYNTLICFLHGVWCSECILQLWDLQRYQAEIVPARLKVLVIIRDQPEAVATFLKNDRHSLTCTIMTDPDGSACQSAGVGGHTLIFLTDRNQVVRRLLHFTDRREKFTPAQWVDDLLDSSEL